MPLISTAILWRSLNFNSTLRLLSMIPLMLCGLAGFLPSTRTKNVSMLSSIS
uniref:Uncharacterized protein n=1 Tax=Arundo donax TaxID=35708 RepID=A0A0A9B508_ARUDO